jgi:hypothetical protein
MLRNLTPAVAKRPVIGREPSVCDAGACLPVTVKKLLFHIEIIPGESAGETPRVDIFVSVYKENHFLTICPTLGYKLQKVIVENGTGIGVIT